MLRVSQTLMGWVQQSRYITAQNFSFKTLKKLDKLFSFHLRHPHHLDKLHSSPRGVDRYLEKCPDVDCDREVTNTSKPWADSTPAKPKPKRVRIAKSPDINYHGKDYFLISSSNILELFANSKKLEKVTSSRVFVTFSLRL